MMIRFVILLFIVGYIFSGCSAAVATAYEPNPGYRGDAAYESVYVLCTYVMPDYTVYEFILDGYVSYEYDDQSINQNQGYYQVYSNDELVKITQIYLPYCGYETAADNTDSENVNQYQNWTIDELGAIIVSAGMFWEEWWLLSGKFSHEFIGWEMVESPWYVSPILIGRAPLLPSSGFENLGDIRNYLLQYFTETWVNGQLHREDPAFIEYNNRLYICVGRAGFPFTNWETAKHVLVQQYGNRAVVHTTALRGAWHMLHYPNEGITMEDMEELHLILEVYYYFILIDSKIDSIITEPGWNLFRQW